MSCMWRMRAFRGWSAPTTLAAWHGGAGLSFRKCIHSGRAALDGVSRLQWLHSRRPWSTSTGGG